MKIYRLIRKYKKLFFFSALLILPALILFLIIQFVFIFKSQEIFFQDSSSKLWGHRGLSKNYNKQSIEEINKAARYGMAGIELDIWYSEDCHCFLVSHDKPNNRSLELESFISQLYPSLYYWFDLKNLEKDNSKNVEIALSELTRKNIVNLNRFIIESKNGLVLGELSEKYNTCYWMTLPTNNILLKHPKKIWSKLLVIMYNYSAVSMPYIELKYYGDLRNKNIHTWTTSKIPEKELELLLINKSVRIILVDKF